MKALFDITAVAKSALVVTTLFVMAVFVLLASIALPQLVLANSVEQANEATTKQQLSQLRQEIQAVEKSLQATQHDQSDLVKQLKLSDIHISKLSKLIRRTDGDLNRQKSRLASMHATKKSLHKQVKQHRQQLALQLRSAHALGQREYLKILLSAQNPSAVSRMLTYLNYLSRQQIQLIQEAKRSYQKLQQTETAIIERSQVLAADRLRQQTDLDKLTRSKKNRTQVIAKLGRKITNKQQKLQILKNNQFSLNQLLNQIMQPQKIDIPPLGRTSTAPSPFKTLKGKLQQPTVGKVIRKYGQPHIGNLIYKGMVFAAKEGQAVLAVAAGQVIYSDWLRGFGMLMIIDHGNQYMSLYGQNTSLHYESGDWVRAQEVIASTGNSGGIQESGLYFELRHRGKPINPEKWLKH